MATISAVGSVSTCCAAESRPASEPLNFGIYRFAPDSGRLSSLNASSAVEYSGAIAFPSGDDLALARGKAASVGLGRPIKTTDCTVSPKKQNDNQRARFGR
jgi:hypothetical protein